LPIANLLAMPARVSYLNSSPPKASFSKAMVPEVGAYAKQHDSSQRARALFSRDICSCMLYTP